MKSSGAQHAGCECLVADSSGDLMLYGGQDGLAGIYSLSKQQSLQALKAGAPVTDVAWYGGNPILATKSGSVKVFDRGTESMSFKAHAGAVTAMAIHPSGEILASVGIDKSYVLYDLEESVVVSQTFTDSGKHFPGSEVARLTSIRAHDCSLPSGWTSLCSRYSKWSDQGIRR